MAASYRIVADERERVADWTRQALHPDMETWGEWYQAIGLERDGELIAGLVYTNVSTANVCMHIAAKRGTLWAKPAFFRAIFAYPFNELGVRRCTALVASRNTDSIRLCQHLGFQYEGTMRHGLPDDDILVLGLLRAECNYEIDTESTESA